ncbi:activating signal cointegrator 1 [Erpetoichthys calabaricus]|uniref:activating signal cointegrator 1 n=1 Tax=Erpetoichthys calabaricus TaxID=27687 RepID=UPI0022348BEC|nr:activating signal cointegrator 1 [Erpetoichthys calabaricus]
MSNPLLRWCQDKLNREFGLEASDDIVEYIISIENAEEIEEYVRDLVQGAEGKKKQFIEEFLERWRCSHQKVPESTFSSMKNSVPETAESNKGFDQMKKSKRKGRNKQEALTFAEQEPVVAAVKTPIDLVKAHENSSSSSKKKTKFINLYAKEGQDRLAVLLPGRYSCECLAQKHRLINNCLNCGRIICEQEGSGPCLFCGSLVCSKEEQEVLQRDSNKSQKLLKKLLSGFEKPCVSEFSDQDLLPHQQLRMKEGLEKAVQHKDKLLEFDKNSVRRTKVIDDESDYYATDSNQWLSKSEREALRKKEEELRNLRHSSRTSRKITIDFAGRQIIDDENNMTEYYSKYDENLEVFTSPSPTINKGQQPLRDLVNPNISLVAPQWMDPSSSDLMRKSRNEEAKDWKLDIKTERKHLRIQDRELQEMADSGCCLSMHQPWASLLVKGIKRVEGRTWYTPHRGRLWIAAAAKRPTPQEISQVEDTYRFIYKEGKRKKKSCKKWLLIFVTSFNHFLT